MLTIRVIIVLILNEPTIANIKNQIKSIIVVATAATTDINELNNTTNDVVAAVTATSTPISKNTGFNIIPPPMPKYPAIIPHINNYFVKLLKYC